VVALENLLKDIAAGDQVALEALYDATSRRVFGLVLRILRDHPAAEEVTLDVYTRVWQQASRFDASRGSAEAWLLTLTHNQAIDCLRSRQRRTTRELPLDPDLDVPDGQPSPETLSIDADMACKVRVALQEIPEEQRKAIVAAYFGGLSHTEIAEAFGEPLGTIKTRIRSGMVALRRALAANLEVPS
jgi:RNA polymerase sigma-70 factor (ECF subfamily)